MKKIQRIAFPVVLTAILVALSAMRVFSAPRRSATSFHFVFSADSRDNYTVLPAFSHKMVTLNPVFGFFGGDLCGSFSTTCINRTWKPAMDANNNDGILAKTFVLRGNHDSGTLSSWQGLWDFAAMASRVGATQYTAQSSDATYSFDYGNSHFVGIDLPGGSSGSMSSTQISWLDSDLSAAESRGIVHEFVFWHGPIYNVTSQHGSEHPSSALKAVLNKHPISAGFFGHEHITQYTHVTTSVESGINSFEEFTMGRAGAPAYSVVNSTTWHADQNAFADIAVNDSQFTVTVYSQSGSALYSKTFTDSSSPTPTATANASSTSGTATYTSIAADDGYVLESTETSSVGGTINATGTTFRLGDDASNRQYRAILSFDTSGLPDNANITSATIKIKQAGSGGSNPYNTLGNLTVDIMKGSFGGTNVLQAGDFQAAASQGAIAAIPNTPVNGVYSKAIKSTYFTYINKLGVTQLRLRFSTDDNNNNLTDYLSFKTSDTSIIADRPVLVIQYTVP